MFDFQKELLDQRITVYHIDLLCTKNFPFEDPYDYYYAEKYNLGEIISIHDGGEAIKPIDPHFNISIELEIKDYLNKAESLKDLNQRIRLLAKERNWYTSKDAPIDLGSAKTHEFWAWEFSLSVQGSLFSDLRSLGEKEAIEGFYERLPSIRKMIDSMVNKYLKGVIDNFLSTDWVKDVEARILSTDQIVREENPKTRIKEASAVLDLSIPTLYQVEFENDLWDMLRDKNFISTSTIKNEFKALFGKGISLESKLDWNDTISTLALFLKNLPIENENVQQIGASAFTCKGKNVSNSQLTNNGRKAKSQKEIDLVTFLEDLTTTYS